MPHDSQASIFDMSFNLVEENWIPVLYANGRFKRVGIRTALTEAGRIRQVAGSNPMDNVALLRFLLAVLQWCKPAMSDDDRARIDGADGIPKNWMTEKLGTDGEPNKVFNLLGDGERFYQDKGLVDGLLKAKQKKWDNQRRKAKSQRAPKAPRPTKLDDDDLRPIGDLLVEFPTETKIAHFRHVRDKQYGLCPACCALGIVRFSAFANYAGRGSTSGINGPAPAYAVAQGSTLLQTLRLHWTIDGPPTREPPWICADRAKGETDLDTIAVFAWRPRRIWLGDPADEGFCSYCGEWTGLVRQLAFTGGWEPPFQTRGEGKKFWDLDPHLILVDRGRNSEADEEAADGDTNEASTRGRKKASTNVKRTTLGFPRRSRRVAAHAGFWRRAFSALQSHAGGAETVLVAGPAASQTGMLYQDAASLLLPCPPADDDAGHSLSALDMAVGELSGVLRSSTPNPDRQHPNRKASLDAMSPALEAALRNELFDWLGEAPASDVENPLDDWRNRLAKRLQPVVEAVVRATTVGSPLRRREAIGLARSVMDDVLRKSSPKEEAHSATSDNSPMPSSPAVKPKRTRNRKEAET